MSETYGESWRRSAACAQPGIDPMMFFPPKAAPDIMRGMEAQAKTVCESCPVQAECLEEALARPEEWGVWGGMTAGERQRLRRRRQRLRRLGRLDGMD